MGSEREKQSTAVELCIKERCVCVCVCECKIVSSTNIQKDIYTLPAYLNQYETHTPHTLQVNNYKDQKLLYLR